MSDTIVLRGSTLIDGTDRELKHLPNSQQGIGIKT